MSGALFLALPVVSVAFALWSMADAIRAVASAIEARSDATTKIGAAEGESVVAKPDAQTGGSNHG